MNTKEILQGTRDLLSDPGHWCQDTSAKNAIGNTVGPLDHDAVSYCLSGAMMKVAGGWDAASPAYVHVCRTLKQRGSSLSGVIFNDWPSTTHQDVLALLDQAILELKE